MMRWTRNVNAMRRTRKDGKSYILRSRITNCFSISSLLASLSVSLPHDDLFIFDSTSPRSARSPLPHFLFPSWYIFFDNSMKILSYVVVIISSIHAPFFLPSFSVLFLHTDNIPSRKSTHSEEGAGEALCGNLWQKFRISLFFKWKSYIFVLTMKNIFSHFPLLKKLYVLRFLFSSFGGRAEREVGENWNERRKREKKKFEFVVENVVKKISSLIYISRWISKF